MIFTINIKQKSTLIILYTINIKLKFKTWDYSHLVLQDFSYCKTNSIERIKELTTRKDARKQISSFMFGTIFKIISKTDSIALHV